jgi:7,8-dihydropterin-6-yl-methyl-4-(beta-D-ribofuranosyl)aminobenzene 5'-phosphate synthase
MLGARFVVAVSCRCRDERIDMLFGGCGCNAVAMSRRGLLCAGGAGFVSALTATLIGASRTAQAQQLTADVPEVNHLAVRIVTDNRVVLFVPSEQRMGSTSNGGSVPI